jgi:outer membrane receptor protein involved in Fe transport
VAGVLALARRQLIRTLLVLAFAATLVSSLSAQRETGVAVTGTVADQTGAVLPAATVELRTPAAASVQTTMSTPTGDFTFRGVAPGRYDVVSTFGGFQQTTVHVTVGNRAPPPLRITMPLAVLTQEVTVGDSPAEVRADQRSNLDSSVVDEQALANLPIFNEDVVGTMSRFLDASAIGTNGVMLVVNGVEVNSLTLPAAAIAQIKINQDPYAPEFRQPGRGRIEIVTKPGSQTYSGTGTFTFRDASMDARNYFAVTKPPEQRRVAEGFLGGPVRHSENTGFTLSLKDDEEDTQSTVVARDLSGLVQTNLANPYRRGLVSGTLTHQQGKNNTIVVTASYENERQRNQGVGGVTLPTAGLDWSSIEQDTIYNQMTVLSPTLLNQIRVLAGNEYENWDGLSQAQKIIVLDAFTGGGSQLDRSRTEHHLTLTDVVSWTRGKHAMKFGFQIPDWSRRRFDDNSNRAGTFYFSSLDDYAASRPYAFIQQAGSGHVVFLEKVLGSFAQDEIRLRPDLTVVIGLRYDWQNYFNDNNNVSPRGSLAWSPLESGRLVVRGGAGLFYDRSGPNPIQDILKYNGTNLVRYTITDPGYPSPLPPGTSAAAPPGLVVLEPGIVIPSMLQFSVAVERELRKGTGVSVTYTGSRAYDQFRSRDINAPAPPLFASRPDPRYAVVREIESEARYRSDSLQVSLKGRFAPRFTGSVQYTLAKASTDTAGVNWIPPNSYDLSLEYARADSDRRHRFDLIGTLNAGAWGNAGAALALYSGQPYSITTGHDDFNTGTANARPGGVPRNSLEGPGYADVDLRWSRELALHGGGATASGPSVVLGVDGFNVFNRVNYSRYIGTLTSPFFGQAIAAQSARRTQLSVRVKF